MVAVTAGAAHSWIVPVTLRLDPSPPPMPHQADPGQGAGVAPPPGANTALDPASTDPASIDPAIIDPAIIDPAIIDPAIIDPASIDPAALGQRITLPEARALYETGQCLFIDTRPKKNFDEGHIMGAFHLSTEEFGQPEGAEVISFLRADEHYILYCDGGDCDASENVAILLKSSGFPLFHILTAGFDEWKAAGYDVEPVGGGQ